MRAIHPDVIIDQAVYELHVKPGYKLVTIYFDMVYMYQLPLIDEYNCMLVPCHGYLYEDHIAGNKAALTHNATTPSEVRLYASYFSGFNKSVMRPKNIQEQRAITITKPPWGPYVLEKLGWYTNTCSQSTLLGRELNPPKDHFVHVDFMTEVRWREPYRLGFVEATQNQILFKKVEAIRLSDGWYIERTPLEVLDFKEGDDVPAKVNGHARAEMVKFADGRVSFYFGLEE